MQTPIPDPGEAGFTALICTALCAVSLLAWSGPAAADPMPGMRGIDHIGITVPDLPQAEAFFTDVLGCTKVTHFGPFSDDKGSFMQDVLDVHPRAVIESIALERCGFGSNVELFKYSAPDQKVIVARNSDVGGHHIAFYVDDIKLAADYLKAKGVKTFAGPIDIAEGPVAGQSILYFVAPWGLQFEAISYPQGMAYEKDATTRLWSTREPAK